MPFGFAGFFMMFITMPLVLVLGAMPWVGQFLSGQFPYLLFALYLLLRYGNKSIQSLCRASLAGTFAMYAIILFVMLEAKGSTDGQTGIGIMIGINAALLIAIITSEILNHAKRSVKDLLREREE